MHEALNIIKNKNYITQFVCNREMNLLNRVSLYLDNIYHKQTKVIVAENFSFRQLNKKKISYPILSYSIHPWHQGHRLPDLLSKDVNGGPRPATRWVFTLLWYQYGVKPVPMGT